MDSPVTLRHLDTPADWARAFAVMKQLRPHLTDAAAFCTQIGQQHEEGYRLLAAFDPREPHVVRGLAGYRTLTNTLYGRFVYLDDLVVDAHLQRGGIGAHLLDAVRDLAREARCAHFVLDTGLHIPLAQRFYYRQGMLARGMHFVDALNAPQENTQ
jgi:GNAT superfamily N-acetyltransferase